MRASANVGVHLVTVTRASRAGYSRQAIDPR
jgi:hypothetical protein